MHQTWYNRTKEYIYENDERQQWVVQYCVCPAEPDVGISRAYIDIEGIDGPAMPRGLEDTILEAIELLECEQADDDYGRW